MRYLFEDCVLDTDKRELRRGADALSIAPRVFDLLDYLIRNREHVVSKDDLISTVWHGRIVSDAAVTTRLNAARSAIGDSGEEQRLIKTLPRKGFRFVGEVREVPGLGPSAVSEISVAAPRFALTIPEKPSIAVLPFTNLSGDPELEYFVDGVVEEIIMALSHLRWLFVIDRNSSFTYKGRAVDVKYVSRELGVRYVLEGSVRKAANRLRIATQLIDATTRAHISSARFNGELKDVFDLQEQVAASVAGAAAPKVEETEIERARRKPTDSLDAYDYFLRAMACVNQWTRETNEEALGLLNKAIELDPNFASAYGQATWCYCFRRMRGWSVAPEQDITEILRLARRAVELGKDDALALCWGGWALAYCVGELEEGAAFMDRAFALNPNLPRAWNLSGWVKILLGEPDIAIEHFARAMRLSPLDPMLHAMQNGTALGHFFAGRYDEASSWAEKSLRQHAQNPEALGILSASCALGGQLEKARRAMARLRQMAPEGRLSNLTLRMPPFRRSEYFAMILEGARKAGLPD